MEYYLVVDIGASSGRLIAGYIENGLIRTKPIYSFKNGIKEKNGHLCWEPEYLFDEIVKGLKECSKTGIIPKVLGIDTWGVDFVLLDKNNKRLGDCVSYRDSRTKGMADKVHGIIPFDELYSKTGIQQNPINTVYQLYALNKQSPDIMESAKDFLMMPDYLTYLLTGDKRNEYTNATTTGLVNARTRDWDNDIIKALGFNEKLFKNTPVQPGTYTVPLKEDIAREVGFNCAVAVSPSHDTASAFIGVPKTGDSVILSSGTWSLLGVENTEPYTDSKSAALNFSNEGGVCGRYRYLKNIMGMWVMQNYRRENNITDYAYGISLAKTAEGFPSVVDFESEEFLAPESMSKAIMGYCERTSQKVPRTAAEIGYCAYNSLAAGYKRAIDGLESITGKKYKEINVVGGGSQDKYLCALTAKRTGCKVIAGPREGTALGNIMYLMSADGVFNNITEARKCLKESTEVEYYD